MSELRLTGPDVLACTLTVDGEKRRLCPAPHLMLLTLLLRRGETVSHETLASALWEHEWLWPLTWRSTIRTYASHIRRAGVAVHRDHAGYRIDRPS